MPGTRPVLAHPPFVPVAFEYACTVGKGFKPWLYTVYSQVKKSLSPDLYTKTLAVRQGDLLGLLDAIKL